MKLLLCFGSFAVMLSACGPTQQWVKPGATEADLRTAITLCDQENLHFGNRITTLGTKPEEDVVATRQRSYRKGGGEMMREKCLESHGWTLEYVD
jgi:hypothetical protein